MQNGHQWKERTGEILLLVFHMSNGKKKKIQLSNKYPMVSDH